MLHRSESLLTLWQHHSLSILWCNTKTGLSRNNVTGSFKPSGLFPPALQK
ncbi:hypothetical protein WHU09_26185 (plasmid) [Escherichia coli]